jgi:cytoskeletal protein CcmA (bactofilin family)
MKKILSGAILAILMVVPFVASGATFKTGQSYYSDPNVVVNDNLYAASGNIGITGPINGDLFVAGGNIMLSGTVSEDVAAGGGTLNITGKITGDARFVGGNINISNSIGGDLIIAGGQINIVSSVSVEKDAGIAGGTVYIDGTINGNLRVAAREIKFGPNALIRGNFDYYSEVPVTLESGAIVEGTTNFHQINLSADKSINKKFIFGLMSVADLAKLMMIFAAALVLFYAFKNQTKAIVERSVSGFWKEALRGFIVLVVAPIAIILSFVTVIGAPLGFIAAFFYAAFLVISSIVSALLFAKLLLKYLFKKDNYELNWWVIAISVLALKLVVFIPFIGGILAFFIFISALGSISDFVWKKIRA